MTTSEEKIENFEKLIMKYVESYKLLVEKYCIQMADK